jgi:hypothetical protein
MAIPDEYPNPDPDPQVNSLISKLPPEEQQAAYAEATQKLQDGAKHANKAPAAHARTDRGNVGTGSPQQSNPLSNTTTGGGGGRSVTYTSGGSSGGGGRSRRGCIFNNQGVCRSVWPFGTNPLHRSRVGSGQPFNGGFDRGAPIEY